MRIQRYQNHSDNPLWLSFRHKLWGHKHSLSELEEEIKQMLSQKKFAVLFALDSENNYVGYIELSFKDSALGCSTANIIYIEGLFVNQNARKSGIATFLIQEAEKLGKQNDCLELASDVELDNIASLKLHQKYGFTQTLKDSKVVYFSKIIK